MRQILVDFARSKRYQKRGGGAIRVTFGEELPVIDDRPTDLIAIHDALSTLEAVDEQRAGWSNFASSGD